MGHKHFVPPELAALVDDDVARANKSLDMLVERYKRQKFVYDMQGMDPRMQLVTFARELQPEGALLSGQTIMLVIALGRMVNKELQ